MSWPRKLTLPLRLESMPISVFSVVDLPAPLRPMSATTSPRRTSRSTSYRICAAPYQAHSALAFNSVSCVLIEYLRPAGCGAKRLQAAVRRSCHGSHRRVHLGGFFCNLLEGLAAAEVHLLHFRMVA